ncbi:hypothetical protein GJ496_003843 [Pomphorhynchus laevis]|nr:hypothetical protein GJ496_003843 [Pomphorhynchus laevis]
MFDNLNADSIYQSLSYGSLGLKIVACSFRRFNGAYSNSGQQKLLKMVPNTYHNSRWNIGYFGRRRRRRREHFYGHSAWNLLRRFDICQARTTNNLSECLQDYNKRKYNMDLYSPLGFEVVRISQVAISDSTSLAQPIENLMSVEMCSFCGYLLLSCGDANLHRTKCSLNIYMVQLVEKVVTIIDKSKDVSLIDTIIAPTLLEGVNLRVAVKTESSSPSQMDCKCNHSIDSCNYSNLGNHCLSAISRKPNNMAILLSQSDHINRNGHFNYRKKKQNLVDVANSEEYSHHDVVKSIARHLQNVAVNPSLRLKNNTGIDKHLYNSMVSACSVFKGHGPTTRNRSEETINSCNGGRPSACLQVVEQKPACSKSNPKRRRLTRKIPTTSNIKRTTIYSSRCK